MRDILRTAGRWAVATAIFVLKLVGIIIGLAVPISVFPALATIAASGAASDVQSVIEGEPSALQEREEREVRGRYDVAAPDENLIRLVAPKQIRLSDEHTLMTLYVTRLSAPVPSGTDVSIDIEVVQNPLSSASLRVSPSSFDATSDTLFLYPVEVRSRFSAACDETLGSINFSLETASGTHQVSTQVSGKSCETEDAPESSASELGETSEERWFAEDEEEDEEDGDEESVEGNDG